MQAQNKDKVHNLVRRSVSALPVAQDLPRLLKQIQLIDGENLLVDPRQKGTDQSLVESFYTLLHTLADRFGGEALTKVVDDTFDSNFKRDNKEKKSFPLVDPKAPQAGPSKTEDELEIVKDGKLKDALKFLRTAFVGVDDSAIFHLDVSKPEIHVSLSVSPKGASIKAQESWDDEDADCTICCSSAILTAILNGSLEASVAMQSGHLKVDNLPKLIIFGKAFDLDKKAFEQYRKSSVILCPLIDETSIFSLALKKYLCEVLGEQNKLVQILKRCNSATVSPAVIDLKFALGLAYMTKDVPGTWKFAIVLNQDTIEIKTRKEEQDLKNIFKYEWELILVHDQEIELQDIQLQIVRLAFNPDYQGPNRKEHIEKVKEILSAYASPDVIEQSENEPWIKEEESLLLAQNARENNNKNLRVEKYFNGDRYEGEFNDAGQKHGHGIYTTTRGDVYIGNFVNGVREGKGEFTSKDGTRYEGEFKNQVPDGQGAYVFSNTDLYHGEFQNAEFHGRGSFSSEDGSSYQGEFNTGQRHGRGVLFCNAATYEGEWKDGLFQGEGIYVYSNGDIYQGQFQQGRFHGLGKYTVAASQEVIECEFKKGLPLNGDEKLIQPPMTPRVYKKKEGSKGWKMENQKENGETRKKTEDTKLEVKQI